MNVESTQTYLRSPRWSMNRAILARTQADVRLGANSLPSSRMIVAINQMPMTSLKIARLNTTQKSRTFNFSISKPRNQMKRNYKKNQSWPTLKTTNHLSLAKSFKKQSSRRKTDERSSATTYSFVVRLSRHRTNRLSLILTIRNAKRKERRNTMILRWLFRISIIRRKF